VIRKIYVEYEAYQIASEKYLSSCNCDGASTSTASVKLHA